MVIYLNFAYFRNLWRNPRISFFQLTISLISSSLHRRFFLLRFNTLQQQFFWDSTNCRFPLVYSVWILMISELNFHELHFLPFSPAEFCSSYGTDQLKAPSHMKFLEIYFETVLHINTIVSICYRVIEKSSVRVENFPSSV